VLLFFISNDYIALSLEGQGCIALNLKEKCFQISILRGYEGKDDKLHYLKPYLAK